MLRVGVIGLGTIGMRFARLVQEDRRTELVTVCDVEASRVKSVSELYLIEGHTKLDEMLDHELDIVCIATPDYVHAEAAVAAAKKGINMIIEKPLTTCVQEGQEIVDAVKTSGIKAKVNYSLRWAAPFAAAKRAIADGRIGEVMSISLSVMDAICVPTEMLSWSAKTSPGWFLMSHILDLARWYVDAEVVRVFGTGRKKVLKERYGIDTYDSLYGVVHFSNGTIAVLEAGWIMPNSIPNLSGIRVEIGGAEGSIRIDTYDQMVHLASTKYEYLPTWAIEIDGKLTGLAALSFSSFVTDLMEDRQGEPTVADGLITTRVLEAVHSSAETGGKSISIG